MSEPGTDGSAAVRALRFKAYKRCVDTALDELLAAGAIDHRQRGRFFSSAVQAFHDAR